MFDLIDEKIDRLILNKNKEHLFKIKKYLNENKAFIEKELTENTAISKKIIAQEHLLSGINNLVDKKYIVVENKILNHYITLKNSDFNITIDLYKYPEGYEIKYCFNYKILDNNFIVTSRSFYNDNQNKTPTAISFLISDNIYSDVNIEYYNNTIFSYNSSISDPIFRYLVANITKPELDLKEDIFLLYDLKISYNSIEDILYKGLKKFITSLN